MKFKRLLALLAALLPALSLCGCGGQSAGEGEYSGLTLRLAYQYGMQYSPAYVAAAEGCLETLLPGVEVEWSNLGGGSAMNEALISGSIDAAFMGIPPALIAVDAGADCRVACGICVPPAELMVSSDSGISSLSDIGENDVIAVPSLGSIQHIMLAMACEKQLGDAHALDDALVAMSNPDAYAALASGSEVAGHFASMPYIAYERADGLSSILAASDCMDGGASIVCVTSAALHENAAVYDALMEALGTAIELINSRDDGALDIIAEAEGVSAETALEYLSWEGTVYSQKIYGLTELGEFMSENGFLENDFAGFEYYVWDGAEAAQ